MPAGGSVAAMSVLDFDLDALDGTPDVLAAARGKVTLLVNVASRCGLTPQYAQLQALQDRYSARGFTVLGVPCNQFLEQEPGTPEEIAEFCSTTYGVTFPLAAKVEVNGEGRHPLYADLSAVADADDGHTGDIRWNFEKFVIGRNGEVLARFAPTVAPDDPRVVSVIDAAL